MTKSEYYKLLVDTSAAGLFPARGQTGCLYRAAGGRRCAVGLLIPDALYDSKMEGKPVLHICKNFPQFLECIPKGLTDTDMQGIQRIHDCAQVPWHHELFVIRLSLLGCFDEYLVGF